MVLGPLLMGALGPRPFLVYAPVQTDRTGDSVQELQKELDVAQQQKTGFCRRKCPA